MVYPALNESTAINQTMYNHIFEVTVRSSTDGAVFKGQFVNSIGLRRLVEAETGDLSFNMTVLNHTTREIRIQLSFDYKSRVSAGNRNDEVSIRLIEPQMFISKETAQSIVGVDSDFEIQVNLMLPRLNLDKGITNSISMTAEIAGKLFESMMQSNFMLQLLISTSMQKIWGTIRSTQTIIYLSLTETPVDYHVHAFIQGAMEFASIDVLNLGQWYQDNFNFEPTPAFSQKFVEMGFSTQNFLINSNSFFIILLFLIAWQLLRALIIRVAVKCHHHPILRRLGYRLHQNRIRVSIFRAQIKLLVESFLDLVLASSMNLEHFASSRSISFAGADLVNSTLVLAISPILILLPAVARKNIISSFPIPKSATGRKH